MKTRAIQGLCPDIGDGKRKWKLPCQWSSSQSRDVIRVDICVRHISLNIYIYICICIHM